jgi:2'-5' RNA ligase
MTSAPSPQGRRIIVAVVTGKAGKAIQSWRMIHDPKEATRLPPHATLCYWAPDAPTEEIEKQVRHAFPAPVEVRLGGVQIGDNDQRTMFVEVLDQKPLDAGLQRLCDGSYVDFPPLRDWRWHVTCVRDTRGRDVEELASAAACLLLDEAWSFDTVALLELRGDAYEPIATWNLAASST